MLSIEEKYKKWMDADIPQELRSSLQQMSSKEIEECFYKDLEFGTGGLRGILGPGSNRLNIFVIRKVTTAFALYLLKTYENAKEMGVVISHDNRLYSRDFTLEAAKVLSTYGIKTYIFDSLRPTPVLSFATRYKKACGGIMITASHNPKEYNGYKVYDEEGCQIVPDKIKPMLDIISSLPSEIDIGYGKEKEAGEIITLGKDVDDAYIEAVKTIQLNSSLNKKGFKIVYSPQHGTGLESAKRLFHELGYNVTYVEEQCSHDPEFKGTASPNPEMPEAYDKALVYAVKENADLILTTDPDADRVGIAFKNKEGKYVLYTGNQTGALLIHYILSQRKEKGILPKDGILFDTIVTSSLGEEIAASFGVKVESVLTGFKFIGEKIEEHLEKKDATFLFGYEESYGYLISPFARDKDSMQALVMISEMVNYYRLQNKCLDEILDEIQKEYHYHEDKSYSIYFDGKSGIERMNEILSSLRENPFKELEGNKVIAYDDIDSLTHYDLVNNTKTKINLPKSNVLKFFLKDGSTIAIRPSGTEPKCKFYYGAVGKTEDDVTSKTVRMHKAVLSFLGL